MFDHYVLGRSRKPMGICTAFMLIVPTTACAIERFQVQPLPDDGFGSTALGCNAGDHSTSSEVVGAMVQADGSTVATKWSWGESNSWIATKLPTPEGLDSVAYGTAFAPLKPAEVVVGIIGILVESVWTQAQPAIWTRAPGGDWALHQIGPNLRGRLNGINEGLFGFYHAVGAIQLPNGDRHAIIATELDAGFQVTDLGTLGGLNSEAADVIIDEGQSLDVVGRAQLPNGDWRATLWRLGDQGEWLAFDLGALGNGQSRAAAAIESPNGFLAVGSSISDAGRSRGVIFWMDVSGDALLSPIDALAVHAGSAASDALWFSGAPGVAGAPMRFRAVGSVWEDAKDSDAAQRSSGAVFNGLFGVFPAVSVVEDTAWDLAALTGIARDGSMIGNGLHGGPGDDRVQAIVLTPTDTHMPDAMSVHRGRAARSSLPQDAWWSDGQYVGIQAERYGSGRTVDAAFEYYMPFLPPDPGSLEIDFTASLVAKPAARVSGALEILVYDHTQGEWATVSTIPIGPDSTTTSVTLPWSEGDWNGDGDVRVRVIVTSDSARGRWGYAIDEITVTPVR